MKAKLTIDGKEIEVEITDEELKKLQNKHTGYERVNDLEQYYYVCQDDGIDGFKERHCRIDEDIYDSANYYTDVQLAKNCARADRLLRQLRRFAVEHRKGELNWGKKDPFKCSIYYSYTSGKIQTYEVWDSREFGQIYFDSRKTAELAIKKFEKELIWYFTKYKDSL